MKPSEFSEERMPWESLLPQTVCSPNKILNVLSLPKALWWWQSSVRPHRKEDSGSMKQKESHIKCQGIRPHSGPSEAYAMEHLMWEKKRALSHTVSWKFFHLATYLFYSMLDVADNAQNKNSNPCPQKKYLGVSGEMNTSSSRRTVEAWFGISHFSLEMIHRSKDNGENQKFSMRLGFKQHPQTPGCELALIKFYLTSKPAPKGISMLEGEQWGVERGSREGWAHKVLANDIPPKGEDLPWEEAAVSKTEVAQGTVRKGNREGSAESFQGPPWEEISDRVFKNIF